MGDLIERYVRWRADQGAANQTLANDRHALRELTAHLTKQRIDPERADWRQLNAAVYAWRADLRARNVAPTTINRHLSAARTLVAFLDLPPLRVPGLSVTRTQAPAVAGDRAQAMLGTLADTDNPRALAIVYLVAAGLNAPAISRLRVIDVDAGHPPRVRGTQCWIALEEQATPALSAVTRDRPADAPLIASARDATRAIASDRIRDLYRQALQSTPDPLPIDSLRRAAPLRRDPRDSRG